MTLSETNLEKLDIDPNKKQSYKGLLIAFIIVIVIGLFFISHYLFKSEKQASENEKGMMMGYFYKSESLKKLDSMYKFDIDRLTATNEALQVKTVVDKRAKTALLNKNLELERKVISYKEKINEKDSIIAKLNKLIRNRPSYKRSELEDEPKSSQ